MRLFVDLHQPSHVEMRVALGRADTGVAEQFLDGTEVGAGLQQVRGERVPQRMRADPSDERGLADVTPHDPVDAPRRQPLPAEIEE